MLHFFSLFLFLEDFWLISPIFWLISPILGVISRGKVVVCVVSVTMGDGRLLGVRYSLVKGNEIYIINININSSPSLTNCQLSTYN